MRSKPLVSHYFDFWFFESYADGAGTKKAKCVGRDNKTGCRDWFKTFWAKNPPVYDYSDWFPPRYQVFGTHRVPISSTNKHIETWVFDEGKDFWNTTCGPWRRWYDKGGWIITPKNERVCSNFYDKNPFVFLTDNGTEQLRQNSTVLHEIERALYKK
uniref:Uncharacterized protein n=1 Tax=Proboscia inermis TaxID=420281 RepID=A0A6T8ICA2_9STRA